jgi:hypothetical protein
MNTRLRHTTHRSGPGLTPAARAVRPRVPVTQPS